MGMLSLVSLIFAIVCFALAGWASPPTTSPYYYRLIAVGLFFWSLSVLLAGVGPAAHR